MFRRLLLAVLLAASMTLSGVSSCATLSGSGKVDCGVKGQPCGSVMGCCEGLRCRYVDEGGTGTCA